MSEAPTEPLAVEIHGSGEPLLMIHGLGGTSNVFTPQAGLLARWYRVVRPDLPGSGRSPPDPAPSLPGFADAVLGLMDRLRIGAAHVVGHSLGTLVCQHMALRQPDRVRSLALLGPVAAPPEAGRAALRERAARARAEGMAPVADALVEGALAAATRTARPEVAALLRELLMRQDPEHYARLCEALAAVEPAAVERIACPTLLVTGDEDGTAPPRTVRRLADRIPGARLLVLGRCGHWPTIERPAEVGEALVNFYFGL